MPIKVERLGRGLYLGNWIDVVKTDDLYISGDEVQALADEDGMREYVVLIRGTHAKSVPIHLNSYVGSVKPGVLGLIVLDAPMGGEIMGRMFNRFMPAQVEFFRDPDDWLARAHALLAEHEAKNETDNETA